MMHREVQMFPRGRAASYHGRDRPPNRRFSSESLAQIEFAARESGAAPKLFARVEFPSGRPPDPHRPAFRADLARTPVLPVTPLLGDAPGEDAVGRIEDAAGLGDVV